MAEQPSYEVAREELGEVVRKLESGGVPPCRIDGALAEGRRTRRAVPEVPRRCPRADRARPPDGVDTAARHDRPGSLGDEGTREGIQLGVVRVARHNRHHVPVAPDQ